jgi:hypothetical protein
MIPYEVDIFTCIVEFAGLKARQTAADYYDSVRAESLNSSDGLSALCRGRMCNAACVDDNQVGFQLRPFDLVQPEPFEQFANLLALVLVDFTPKSVYRKGSHNVV